jgi:putative DNA primase/helicase
VGEKRRWRINAKRPSPSGIKDHGFELAVSTSGGYYLTCSLNGDGELRVLEEPGLQALYDAIFDFKPKKNRDLNGHAALPSPRDHDQVALTLSALAWLRNDSRFVDRDDWIVIGAAVHDGTGGSAEGRSAWTAWTAKAGHEDAADACGRAWPTITPDGGVTVGTLFKHARDDGWPDPRQQRKRHDDPLPHDSQPDGRDGHRQANGHAGEAQGRVAVGGATTDAEIKRLAKLSKVAYDREREAAAKLLQLRIGTLDKLVDGEHKELVGTDMLPEIEPWPERVDGAALIDEVANIIKRHVSVPTRAEDAIALWVVHTHCLDAADWSPRLAITSPTHGCGKTTLMTLITDLVPRALEADGISPAAVYRSIEKWRPTLLLDEIDSYLPDNEPLRGALNSGHQRGKSIVRVEGDNHEVTLFSTWCALAVALIGNLPDTLRSRSIHIELQRRAANEQLERYRRRNRPYTDVARKIARWTQDNIEALRDAEPDMPEELVDRSGDNWRALLAIADRAGGMWGGPTGKAREAALTLNRIEGERSIGVELLADIRTILADGDGVSSDDLATKLAEMEDRPWPEFGKAKKPITKNAIARLLKPFAIKPDLIDHPITGSRCRGYQATDLRDVFARYLPLLPR